MNIEKELTWIGGYFDDFCPSSYLDLDTLELFKRSNGEYVKVGKLPFLPVFEENSSCLHGSWYQVVGLTNEQNQQLKLSHCHYSGSLYTTRLNENSPFAWVSYFFNNYIKDVIKKA